MGNDQPALRALFACEPVGSFRTANRSGSRFSSFDLEKKARQMAKFARCPFAKTTANCSNSFRHFHLISSVNRLQRPFIFNTNQSSFL